jgi:hypothetical protein
MDSASHLGEGFVEEAGGFVDDRDFHVLSHMESAFGVQFTTYRVPATLGLIYGSHPVGLIVFARLPPVSGERADK